MNHSHDYLHKKIILQWEWSDETGEQTGSQLAEETEKDQDRADESDTGQVCWRAEGKAGWGGAQEHRRKNSNRKPKTQ